MDTSPIAKSRDSVTRTSVGRRHMVRTDLSPSQSVNAKQQSSVPHHAPDTLTRDPSLDPQYHAVLERELERERRRRARKDDILQRQKAYGKSVEQPELQHDDETPHTDFEV